MRGFGFMAPRDQDLRSDVNLLAHSPASKTDSALDPAWMNAQDPLAHPVDAVTGHFLCAACRDRVLSDEKIR